MKPAVHAAVLLVLVAACGKVGDPKPPINRKPLAVSGLSAGQSGHVVTLSWTNPARYVDTNGITDLAYVRILQNGVQIAREKAQPAGQPQTFTTNVASDLDSELTFAVQAETTRGTLSPLSEAVRIRPKEIPGTPRLPVSKVDLDRIILDWTLPERNPQLAEIFLVQRADRPGVVSVNTNHYEDDDYEPGKAYSYTIRAARAGPPLVPGETGVTFSVTAIDKDPPAIPTGLVVDDLGPVVQLTWDENKERDFKEYLVYRSDKTDGPSFPPTFINALIDPNPRPGLTYQLVAVDKSGLPSKPSEPKGP